MFLLIVGEVDGPDSAKGATPAVKLSSVDSPAKRDPSYDERVSVEPQTETFEAAIAAIEAEVLVSCAQHAEWPARIAAGIRAALDFAVANPRAARTLMIDSRSGEPEAGNYLQMIGRFTQLLGEGAPQEERLPASSDEAVVCAIATIVSYHVRTGTVDRLREGDPDLVFLALLPYVGFAEASRWSRSL